ncbi:MAG: glycosyltransferase family 2 protein [Burkholderiales bacterium]
MIEEPATVDVSVVVPVYRSAPIVPALVARTCAALAGAAGAPTFEIVLVCDASPDDSWTAIRAASAADPRVRGVLLRRNAGQHNATMAGLHHARGAKIVVMDDDLQHPPEAIPSMLARLDEGFDVCYTRYLHRKHPLWKRLGSAVNDHAARVLLGKPANLYLSSFKALQREVAREVVRYDGPFAYVDGLLLDVTRHITTVDIEHGERHAGAGNYTLRTSLQLWLKMATSFSVYPLRLMAVGGFVLAMISAAFGIGIAIYKLMHPEIPAGWTSLIATILFVGGIQMLGLGLLGEYLGRAYLKLNRKPQFVVRTTTFDP